MKSLLVILASFMGSLALAAECPNLSGSYQQTFPTATGAVLNVHGAGATLDLSLNNGTQQPWTWQVKTDGQPHEKSMGRFYRDVVEIAKCEDRQVHTTLYGKQLDGDRVVNFTQQWILYKNTSGELVWQINYHDDTDEEPRLSIFKYSPR